MKIKFKTIIIFILICLLNGISYCNALESNLFGNTNQPTIVYVDDDYTPSTPGWGYDHFNSVLDGVNAVSDDGTVIVYAGIYHENQVVINKALTVQGAGWASTVIDGGGATLSSEGLVRIVANSDVTFNGFTIRNAGGPINSGDYNDNLTNVGIYAQSSSSSATFYISGNKIFGTNEPDDWEDYGFYTNDGQEHIIFTNNIVTETAGNAVLVERHIGVTDIIHNALDAGCWGIDPIYFMTYGGQDIMSVQNVSNNTIDVGTGVNPHGPDDNKITAIGFSSAYLGSTGVSDSGRYSNIKICNNIIDNVQAYERGIALDNFAWGNGLGGEISSTVIMGNVINGLSTEPTSFGIRLSGLVTNTVIERNLISNCDMSFWGRSGYYGDSTVYPTGTLINYNHFKDNGNGLIWEGSTLLDARFNWWGDASGPYHPIKNPYGLGDTVSDNVSFTPWLENYLPTIKITYPKIGYLYFNFGDNWITLSFPFIVTFIIGRINFETEVTKGLYDIDRVEFCIDDNCKYTDYTHPYSWLWNEQTPFYKYTIKAIVYDVNGFQTSDVINIWKCQYILIED